VISSRSWWNYTSERMNWCSFWMGLPKKNSTPGPRSSVCASRLAARSTNYPRRPYGESMNRVIPSGWWWWIRSGGQADALNAGINVAASPVIGLLDPLCEFEPTILLSLIRPMLDDPGASMLVFARRYREDGRFPRRATGTFLYLHGHSRASGKQYRVAFVPEAVSYVRAPDSFAELRSRTTPEEQGIARALGHRKSISGGILAIG
jgi:hypothetical protein